MINDLYITLYFIVMKVLLFVCIFLYAITALPNKASYIKAQGRPLNIAHRGLASILP